MEFGRETDRKRRFIGLGFVILLHVAVIYALLTGLARKVVQVVPAPIETEIVDDVRPDQSEPEPPPPTLVKPPAPFVPPPEIKIRQPPPPSPDTITRTSPDPKPRETIAHRPTRTPPQINAGKNCPEPEYPSLSLRLGERGTVVLQFLIGVSGRVRDSKVVQSSGHPRLDEAARRSLSRCHFVPGTEDGQPIQSWAKLQYTWRIPD